MGPTGSNRRGERTLALLLVVTALSLGARLVSLGTRIAHWDEGRVGYDILRYSKTGLWEYRPEVHGPFLPHVNNHVFAVLGPDDFSARLVVAVVGGLLPLSLWLYRDRLRDTELAAGALLLAADPVLLYYSRFMRNDVLVAGFAFVGVGFYVRFIDTRRTRYLYAGTATWALAFASKENALLYVLTILGAVVLLFDHRLFLARRGPVHWTTLAWRYLRRAGGLLRRYKLPLAVAGVEFLVVIVYFYAPRAPPGGGVGLWNVVGEPSMAPAVLREATIGSAEKLVASWGPGSGLNDDPYLPLLEHYVEVLARVSAPIVSLAALGFVSDRYAGERPRDVVALMFYWGFVSALGFPLVTSIESAWTVINTVVPFAIPAAVGAALVFDRGRATYRRTDEVTVALAAVVLVLAGGHVGATAVSTSYLDYQSEDNVLVQWAQPEGELRPVLHDVREAARETDGLDVVWYGRHYVVEDQERRYRPPVGGGCEDTVGEPRMCWYNRLPLPWYLESFDANVSSARNVTAFERLAGDESPPVVITRPRDAPAIENRLAGYEKSVHEARQYSAEYVFYVDDAYAA